MGKVSVDDKLKIQTLHEQGLEYRAIAAKYPEKNWKLNTEHFEDDFKETDSLKCQISMFRLISIQAL